MAVLEPFAVVDTHVHVVSADRERYPIVQQDGVADHWVMHRPQSTEQLLDHMDQSGVAKAVLVQPGPMVTDNRYVVDSASAHRDRAVAVCVLDEFAPDANAQLERLMANHDVAGIRLSVVPRAGASEWLADTALEPLWATAIRLSVPVCVHVRWHGLEHLRQVVERHPDLDLALDHMAHAKLDDGPPFRQLEALLELAKYPRACVKFSSQNLFPLMKQPNGALPLLSLLIERFGAQRLMWGSNVPSSPGSYPELVDMARQAVAGLPRDDAEWLMGKTALKFYRRLEVQS